MDVALAMTWLLVSTSPDDVSTMPVPAPEPPSLNVDTMSTTAGLTRALIADTSAVPRLVLLPGDEPDDDPDDEPDDELPGEVAVPGDDRWAAWVPLVLDEPCRTAVVMAAPTPPAIRAPTRAATSIVRPCRGVERGGAAQASGAVGGAEGSTTGRSPVGSTAGSSPVGS